MALSSDGCVTNYVACHCSNLFLRQLESCDWLVLCRGGTVTVFFDNPRNSSTALRADLRPAVNPVGFRVVSGFGAAVPQMDAPPWSCNGLWAMFCVVFGLGCAGIAGLHRLLNPRHSFLFQNFVVPGKDRPRCK